MRNRGPLRSVGPDLRGPLARDACPFCEDRLFDARQRPRLHSIWLVDREMSKSGALDLATGVGGKIKKEDVQSAVEQLGADRKYVLEGGDPWQRAQTRGCRERRLGTVIDGREHGLGE
ncbi:hypothetical protein B296_00029523 [Ensete ventricosum]|uniref:Uncharacterized protein n=1 Tax=Ensete ventricosum TaxID=4639 RepID=A0A426YF47_ENSVE|nr:hypothetical protein B296_00029523 [Ensete ventricosum]